jgi:serine/threonine protein kinase
LYVHSSIKNIQDHQHLVTKTSNVKNMSKPNKCKQTFTNLKNEMDKYEVIKLLGEGSFGRVYKAKIVSDGSFVALKVISKVF